MDNGFAGFSLDLPSTPFALGGGVHAEIALATTCAFGGADAFAFAATAAFFETAACFKISNFLWGEPVAGTTFFFHFFPLLPRTTVRARFSYVMHARIATHAYICISKLNLHGIARLSTTINFALSRFNASCTEPVCIYASI